MAIDPYVYPGTNVLKNKVNIKDSKKLDKFEHDISLSVYRGLKKKPVQGNFDYQHLQAIHKELFGKVYDWAGEPRTIGIKKSEPLLGGASVEYPHPRDSFPPENLQNRADYVFSKLEKDNYLKGLDRKQFIEKLAKHSTEIWEAHPFREGNTRTTVAFMDQLAKEAGHEMTEPLLQQEGSIRDAFVKAYGGNYEPLKNTIAGALGRREDLERSASQGPKENKQGLDKKEDNKPLIDNGVINMEEALKRDLICVHSSADANALGIDAIARSQKLVILDPSQGGDSEKVSGWQCNAQGKIPWKSGQPMQYKTSELRALNPSEKKSLKALVNESNKRQQSARLSQQRTSKPYRGR